MVEIRLNVEKTFCDGKITVKYYYENLTNGLPSKVVRIERSVNHKFGIIRTRETCQQRHIFWFNFLIGFSLPQIGCLKITSCVLTRFLVRSGVRDTVFEIIGVGRLTIRLR